MPHDAGVDVVLARLRGALGAVGLRDAGLTRVLFFVPSVAKDEALKVLDAYADVARKVG